MPVSVAAGVEREWLENEKILVYTASSLDVAALHKWNGDLTTFLEEHVESLDWLSVLFDLKAGGVSLPFLIFNNYEVNHLAVIPQGVKRIMTILATKPDLTVHYALVIPNTLSGKIVLSRARGADRPQVIHKVFATSDPAIEWLRESSTAQNG